MNNKLELLMRENEILLTNVMGLQGEINRMVSESFKNSLEITKLHYLEYANTSNEHYCDFRGYDNNNYKIDNNSFLKALSIVNRDIDEIMDECHNEYDDFCEKATEEFKQIQMSDEEREILECGVNPNDKKIIEKLRELMRKKLDTNS